MPKERIQKKMENSECKLTKEDCDKSHKSFNQLKLINVIKDTECKLTKEDCDKLEELRISLWDNKFE